MTRSPERRALILMDFQVAVCGLDGELARRSGAARQTADRGVLPRLAQTLRRARATDDLIVHVRVLLGDGLRRLNRGARFETLEESGMFAPDSAGAAFCPEAQPAPGELIVTKSCVSPFAGTGLDELLRANGVQHLLLAGVATNFVVESAARHAGDRGYYVKILEDLCAAHSDEMHQFAITRTLPVFAQIASAQEAYSGLTDQQPKVH